MSEFSELGMSVLVCGKSRPLRQALQASLRAMGCQTVADAGNVDDINAVLASQHIDVALIGNAAETDLSARLQDGAPDLPIICLTQGDCEPGSQMLELQKPFRPMDLITGLKSALTDTQRRASSAMAV
jgi:DNA-binding NtrC family response regulator